MNATLAAVPTPTPTLDGETLSTLDDFYSFTQGTGSYTGTLKKADLAKLNEAALSDARDAAAHEGSLSDLYRRLADWKDSWLVGIVHTNEQAVSGPDWFSSTDLAKRMTTFAIANPLRADGVDEAVVRRVLNGIAAAQSRGQRDKAIRAYIGTLNVPAENVEAAVDAEYKRQGKLSPAGKKAQAKANKDAVSSEASSGASQHGSGEADKTPASPFKAIDDAVTALTSKDAKVKNPEQLVKSAHATLSVVGQAIVSGQRNRITATREAVEQLMKLCRAIEADDKDAITAALYIPEQ